MRRRLPLPIAFALGATCAAALAACSDTTEAQSPTELYKTASAELRDGKYADAAKHLREALDGMGDDTSSDLLSKLHVSLARASAHLNPVEARTAFEDFVAEHPGMVDANDFADVANALMDADDGVVQAAELVSVAKKQFPDQAALFEQHDTMIKDKIASGALDQSEMDKLKSLGYL